MHFDIGPYDPCPCGSGAKYKFCCAAGAKAQRHGKFPVGTVCYYGPDDKTTTKIAAGVVLREGDGPAFLERFVGTDVARDPKVAEQVKAFFARHGVKSVVATDGNLGCPHEEGPDFPVGQDCPFCPFWAGKQGTARRNGAFAEWEVEDPDDDDDDDDEGDELEDADGDEADAASEPTSSTIGALEPESELGAQDPLDRVDALLGDARLDMDQALDVLLAHLRANLRLPCEVTGGEDFKWEEPYVLGGLWPREYKRLKMTQPSYRDRYQLLSIDRDGPSEWMLFWEDIAAHVRRTSDGKRFVLGLSELEATDKKSENYRLLDDYTVWFVNNR